MKRATTSAGAVLAAGAVFGGAMMSKSVVDPIQPGDGEPDRPGLTVCGCRRPVVARDGVGAAVGLAALTVDAPAAPGGTARVTGAMIVGDILARATASPPAAGVPVLPLPATSRPPGQARSVPCPCPAV